MLLVPVNLMLAEGGGGGGGGGEVDDCAGRSDSNSAL